MRPTLLLVLLAAPLVLALPFAEASHPCTGPTPLVVNRFAVVGVFTGDCVGAYAGQRLFDCFPVEWGVLTDAFGVGGHSTCGAMAYVAPGGIVDAWGADLLP